jgi:microcystin-dependent protein
MSTPFLSEIKIVSFNFPPKGWAFCNGQLLPINQNQALFSLLGTTYGGDGRVNFGLPNLQSRVPIHMGNGHTLGEVAGEQDHTLSLTELAAHNHVAVCSSALGTQASPSGGVWATDNNGNAPYSTSPGATMSPSAIGPTGGSQAHQNMAPYLTLNFCIALQGIFPSQN